MRLAGLLCGLALAGTLVGQDGPPVEISLKGVIDLHCHSGPDAVARVANSFEVVRQARTAGMRGVVLKNHYVSTAALAQLAMQELGGIEVFGGIVLNRAAGGINPEAVRRMIQVEGRTGRIVWLPTFDAENQVRSAKEERPFVAVVRDGKPVPALAEVFQIAAEADLVLATGHSSAADSIIVLEAARKACVKRLLVTHALTDPTRFTIEEMKRVAALGAVIECTWLALLSGTNRAANVTLVADCARAIQAVGAANFAISSDLGQANNPLHTEGLRTFIAALN
ncbi:MAG: DUF6282 family protein, partial [Opitutaceae bacterium]